MTASIVALDLETVVDLDLGRRAWNLAGDDAAVRAAMVAKRLTDTDGRSDFFPPAFQRVVGVGWARYDAEPAEGGLALNFSASAVAVADERACLQAALKIFEGRPQIVTWNGGGFDLAVLRHRCLMRGPSLAPLCGPRLRGQDDYGYRYGKAHVDLMDVLSGYGAAPRCTLHDVAVGCGLPGKGDTTAADVQTLVDAGAWERIATYVEQDALTTLLLFLRWQAATGELPRKPYLDARQYFGLAEAGAITS